MKRSEINTVLKRFEKKLHEHKFELPPFLYFTPADWESKNEEYDEIFDNMLGWDVTDYGMNDYNNLGIALITIRNGNVNNPKYNKTYAEKIIMIEGNQVSPNHFHWDKMEDIINRGGGNIVFTLSNADEEGNILDTDVLLNMDGRSRYIQAGSDVVLHPGESITLYPYLYHEFRLEKGSEYCLVGEVSMCNDDNTDNRFEKPLGRFPKIEEDEVPYRLLCTEYRK